MLKIIINDKEYTIRFKHENYSEMDCLTDLSIPYSKKKELSNKTTCIFTISELDTKDCIDISYGYAYCKKEDKFSRKIGRKLSLTKAIASIINKDFDFFTKNTRRLIWDDYFKWSKQ
jgi:hypothetical protein